MLEKTAKTGLRRPLPDYGTNWQLPRSCQTRPQLAYGVLSLDFTRYKWVSRLWHVSSVQILQKTCFTSKISITSILRYFISP